MPLFTDEKKKEIKHNIVMILSVNNILSINHIRLLLDDKGIVISWRTVKRYLDELVDEGLLTMFNISTIYYYSIKN